MKVNIKTLNMEMTQAISDYLAKRIDSFHKLIDRNDESIMCDVEVGKTTNHHHSGDIFRAEVRIHIAGKEVYVFAEKDNLYSAIDHVKDEALHALRAYKTKKNTLFRKGGLVVKRILRGFGRN